MIDAGRWEILTEEAREALARLTLRPRVRADGRVGGVHPSSHTGQSLEFADLKGYAFGDDPRGIDWKVLARTDKVYVRRYLDETNLAAWLVVDASASMNQPLAGTKYRHAASILAGLAYVLLRQGDEVGVLVAHARHPRTCPPRGVPSHLAEVCGLLADVRPSGPTVLGDFVVPQGAGPGRRGLVVLASDMLTDWQASVDALGAAVGRGSVAVLLHVLSIEERTFPFTGTMVFRSAETGESALLDARALRKRFLAAVEAFAGQVRTACHDAGVHYHPVDMARAPHVEAAAVVRAVDGGRRRRSV